LLARRLLKGPTMLRLHHALCLLPLLAVPLACSSSPDGETTGETTSDALTSSTAIARAEEWVNAKLHYCQAPNHQRDYDPACAAYCNRENNPAWNPYRSDCSGFVSFAWKLPAPGRVTWELAPFQNDISHEISAIDLEPGDAVNNHEHIMLFKEWLSRGRTAVFLEEPGCSSQEPYAHALTSSVSVSGSSIYVDYEGASFTAIRYDHLSNAPPAKPPPIPDAPSSCRRINAGEGLGPGQETVSCDGRFRLVMQTDGNLVLYEHGHGALWATGTHEGYVAIMQHDGNFVVYDKESRARWASDTDKHVDSFLALQDDGNLVVYEANAHALWASNTCCR
jgi:hypothetical protein